MYEVPTHGVVLTHTRPTYCRKFGPPQVHCIPVLLPTPNSRQSRSHRATLGSTLPLFPPLHLPERRLRPWMQMLVKVLLKLISVVFDTLQNTFDSGALASDESSQVGTAFFFRFGRPKHHPQPSSSLVNRYRQTMHHLSKR